MWAYLPHCDQVAKASGPSSGIRVCLPKVMLSPVIASTTKQVAVIQ